MDARVRRVDRRTMKRVIVVACSWAAALCLALTYLVIGWGIDDIAGNNAWSTWWIGLLRVGRQRPRGERYEAAGT